MNQTQTQTQPQINQDLIKCAISYEIMSDPVILFETGSTYERENIVKWLMKNDKDPLTNKKLKSKKVVTNWALRHIIESQGHELKPVDESKNPVDCPEYDPNYVPDPNYEYDPGFRFIPHSRSIFEMDAHAYAIFNADAIFNAEDAIIRNESHYNDEDDIEERLQRQMELRSNERKEREVEIERREIERREIERRETEERRFF